MIEVHPRVVRHGHLAAATADLLILADDEKRQRRNRRHGDQRKQNAQPFVQTASRFPDVGFDSNGVIHLPQIFAYHP